MKKGIDKKYSIWYKYSYSLLMRIESRTGRGCDALRLHHKEIDMVDIILLGESDDPDPCSKESS